MKMLIFRLKVAEKMKKCNSELGAFLVFLSIFLIFIFYKLFFINFLFAVMV